MQRRQHQPQGRTYQVKSMADGNVLDSVQTDISTADSNIAAQLEVLRQVLSAWRNLDVEDLKKTYQDIRQRFDDKRLVIAVSGLTSAGKSSFLNALLGFDFLFTAPDHCTPCSVSMERSPKPNATYYRKIRDDKDIERDINELAAVTDAKSDNPSDQPLFVYLSDDQADRGILRVSKQLRLVDSPGIYEQSFAVNSDLNVDAFAFIIDICCGTNWDDLNEVMQMKGLKTKPVLIVFSKIDAIQRFDQNRYDTERERRFNEAKDFLARHNKPADNAIFFLASKAAVVKRSHDSEVKALKEAVLMSKEGQTGDQTVLLIGTQGNGKTSLCADLIGNRLPVKNGDSTPCFVVYTATSDSKLQVNYEQLSVQESGSGCPLEPNIPGPTCGSQRRNQDLRREGLSSNEEDMFVNMIKAATKGNTSSKINTKLPKQQMPQESLLQHQFCVVDTPPMEDMETPPEPWMKPSVLIIVSSSERPPTALRNFITKCLKTAGATRDTAVFFVVTKWNTFCETHARDVVAERKRLIIKTFHDCMKLPQQSSVRRVFFIESEELMDEYEASFKTFEDHLIHTGCGNFDSFKLKPIRDSVTDLFNKSKFRLQEQKRLLEETERFFNNFAQSIRDEFITVDDEIVHLRRNTRVSRFLGPNRQLPDNESEMKGLLEEFLKYYHEDITKEILQLSQKTLEQFPEVDDESKRSAKEFHDKEMKAIADKLELKDRSVSDSYDLRNMFEDFIALIPRPVDLMELDNLRKEGKELLSDLQNLTKDEVITAEEMQRVDQQWNRVMSTTIDTSSDDALAANYSETLEKFNMELKAFASKIEKQSKIVTKARAEADRTCLESTKKIIGIQQTISRLKDELEEKIRKWNEEKQKIWTQFKDFIWRGYYTKEAQKEQEAKQEEIARKMMESETCGEDVHSSIQTAQEAEEVMSLQQADRNKLLERKKAIERELSQIFNRTRKATQKMEADKRTISERKEQVGQTLTQQRSRIQETHANYTKTQERLDDFLEKKERWDTAKSDYYNKLLDELENMSNILLVKILLDLHDRTLRFATGKIHKLKNEKDHIEYLLRNLETMSIKNEAQ